jgi:hypothetical protein
MCVMHRRPPEHARDSCNAKVRPQQVGYRKSLNAQDLWLSRTMARPRSGWPGPTRWPLANVKPDLINTFSRRRFRRVLSDLPRPRSVRVRLIGISISGDGPSLGGRSDWAVAPGLERVVSVSARDGGVAQQSPGRRRRVCAVAGGQCSRNHPAPTAPDPGVAESRSQR